MVRNHEPERADAPGRCPEPRVKLPDRGAFLGVAVGAPGAPGQVVAARLLCEPGRARLLRITRPFATGAARRAPAGRLAALVEEEAREAGGRLAVGLGFPFSLPETQLRELGVLRQAIAGPVALARVLAERYHGAGGEGLAAAERIRAEVGRDRQRVTECYRAVSPPPGRGASLRRAVSGILSLAEMEASVLPWDRPEAGRPVVVEVHPPHVPRALAGICGYRDGEGEGRPALRASVLRRLRSAAGLSLEVEQAAEIAGDGTGAALDAVLAAVAVASAAQDGFRQVPPDAPRSEGWIYSIPEEPWRS